MPSSNGRGSGNGQRTMSAQTPWYIRWSRSAMRFLLNDRRNMDTLRITAINKLISIWPLDASLPDLMELPEGWLPYNDDQTASDRLLTLVNASLKQSLKGSSATPLSHSLLSSPPLTAMKPPKSESKLPSLPPLPPLAPSPSPSVASSSRSGLIEVPNKHSLSIDVNDDISSVDSEGFPTDELDLSPLDEGHDGPDTPDVSPHSVIDEDDDATAVATTLISLPLPPPLHAATVLPSSMPSGVVITANSDNIPFLPSVTSSSPSSSSRRNKRVHDDGFKSVTITPPLPIVVSNPVAATPSPILPISPRLTSRTTSLSMMSSSSSSASIFPSLPSTSSSSSSTVGDNSFAINYPSAMIGIADYSFDASFNLTDADISSFQFTL
jgi:hypothetical protein